MIFAVPADLPDGGPWAGPLEGEDECAWIERNAANFAAMPRDRCELTLSGLAEQAISTWHLGEARLWQRVRYRARLIRCRKGEASPAVSTEPDGHDNPMRSPADPTPCSEQHDS